MSNSNFRREGPIDDLSNPSKGRMILLDSTRGRDHTCFARGERACANNCTIRRFYTDHTDTSPNFLTLGNVGSYKEVCMQYDSAAHKSSRRKDWLIVAGDKIIIIRLYKARSVCSLADVDFTLHGLTIPHTIAIFKLWTSKS